MKPPKRKKIKPPKRVASLVEHVHLPSEAVLKSSPPLFKFSYIGVIYCYILLYIGVVDVKSCP